MGRFRVNVFRQRGSFSAMLRKLRFGGPAFEEVGLPEVIRSLADEPRGLVLVTGPTGSGKTTTLAAMIDHLNHMRQSDIVTIEEPIEVLFRDDVASIDQLDVGNDTGSFLSALRAALRQDPDVILIGETRDPETVRIALQAAETGQLVLSTLHKILVNTGRIADRISDADKTTEIHDVIADGGYYGMITFDQSLLGLVKAGKVSVEAALTASSNPHDFPLELQQARIPLPG